MAKARWAFAGRAVGWRGVKTPGAPLIPSAGRLEPPVWVTRLRGPTPVEASRRLDIDPKRDAPQDA